MERNAFIKKYTNDVLSATKGTGLFPSVTMAQMIIESADSHGQSGEGITARLANNFFGIKADAGWHGMKLAFNTPNDKNKISYFRKYFFPVDSIKDHSDFLIKNSRYRTNGVFTAKTPQEQTDRLAKAGYSEKPYPQYANALNTVIKLYGLEKLDKMTAFPIRTIVILGLSALVLSTGIYFITRKPKHKLKLAA